MARSKTGLICLLTSDPAKPFSWETASYGAWFAEAERRHKRGERQENCTNCGKWRWPDEICCDAPRITIKEHNALIQQAKQIWPSPSTKSVV